MIPPGTSDPRHGVLVTEDDPEIRYLLSQILGDDDREVLLAETAAQGPTATLPVIVLTSRTGAEIRAECYELGADSFVEKPFDPEVLASDVALRLQRAASGKRESFRDLLTGLLNLPGLLHEMEPAGEGARPVIVFEVDGIRRLSSQYGWGTAEMTVCLVSEALASQVVEEVRKVPVGGPDRETFRLTASAGLWAGEGGGPSLSLLEAGRGLAQTAQVPGPRGVDRMPRVALGSVAPTGPVAKGAVPVADNDEAEV